MKQEYEALDKSMQAALEVTVVVRCDSAWQLVRVDRMRDGDVHGCKYL